ncbi:unnamed protein product, partial [Brachionus calyciflorus]
IEYHDEIINKIDIQTELILSKVILNDETNNLSQTRETLISKVNQLKLLNLDSFAKNKQSSFVYCHFLANLKQNVSRHTFNKIKAEFGFQNKIGKLIISKIILNENVVSFINTQIFERGEKGSNFYGKDSMLKEIQNFVEAYVVCKLLYIKCSNESPIIDLTNVEENNLNSLRFGNGNLDNFDFNRLKNLINFDLIKSVDFDPIIAFSFEKRLENFKNLTYLVIYKSNISFEGENFKNMNQLISIMIYRCNLIKLENNIFNNLINLEILLLQDNNIEEIEENSFKGLDKLECINLESNNLRTIKKNVFYGLKSLITLNLSQNKIKIIEPNSFDCLKNLDSINLLRNQIEDLDKDLFKFNRKLRYLNIMDNLIWNLDFIKHLNNLKCLDLSNGKKILIPVDEISKISIPSLEFLSLSCNKFPIFNENFKNLKTLACKNLVEIAKEPFDNLSNLIIFRAIFDRYCINSLEEKITVDQFSHELFDKLMNKNITHVTIFRKPLNLKFRYEEDEKKFTSKIGYEAFEYSNHYEIKERQFRKNKFLYSWLCFD